MGPRRDMSMDIVIEDERWTACDLESIAGRATDIVLSEFGLGDAEFSILACDDARIATLNEEFRGKPTPTNVLSWPEEDLSAEDDGDAPFAPSADPDGTFSLGDIAIAYETCAREAEEHGKPFQDHVTHLIIHGVLHLLGYDHIRDKDATRMEAIEVKLLGMLGVADPY